jgi:phage tail sheath protein FI
MPVLTYPGVYIEEVPSGVRTITGVATSIALFIGWAPRGPIDRAVRLTSYTDFVRNYGGGDPTGLDSRSLLGYAVRHFYDNGGADAYVLRIAADDAAPATATIGGLNITASSPGDWAHDYEVHVTPRADDNDRFRLDVVHAPSNGAIVESFENLSMVATDARFVEAVINGRSAFITVDATNETSLTLDDEPLAGGDPGAVIDANHADFISALILAFDGDATAVPPVDPIVERIDLFNLVNVPGLADGGTIANLQQRCAARRAFLLVDGPESDPVATVLTTVAGLNITGTFAPNSALYYPWVRAPDPLQQNALRAFPPCGSVAGVYARTDGSRGVWKAPAGSEASLTGAAGLVVTMSDRENGQLNPRAVNCLRTLPVFGTVVWGARTLHGDDDRGSEWKYIPVRRITLFIEESLYRGTQWVVFEPNDEPLWAQIRLNVGAFMQNLFRQGAFQGRSPREAYFVKCDSETTTQNDINLGIVNIHVGFAPLKPAEFVVIRIQQMAGQVEA